MNLDFSAVPGCRTGAPPPNTFWQSKPRRAPVDGPMAPEGWPHDVACLGRRFGQADPAAVPWRLGPWIHWIRNVQPLAQHFTVYAADLPGLGDSDPPDDVRDVWSVTRCVKTAMDGLLPPGEPFAITGFSFGGMVAGHIATLFEQRISRIVMVGAGGLKATRKPGPKLRKLLPEMPAETLAAEARRNLEILMMHDPAKVDGVAIYMQILNTTRAKTRSRDMGQAFKLSEVLPRVKTPLSGIWGEFDSTTYPHIQERIDLFRALQPDFVMNVIPEAGHWVAYEAAEAFNKKLLEVLDP